METLNIVIQVAQSEHESEERVIIRRKDEEGVITPTVMTYSSFSLEEKAVYDAFKTLIESK